MGNFAHKFNTCDIKPKLGEHEEIVCSDIVRQLSTLSRTQFFLNTAIHTEEQSSAFYCEESLLFSLLLIKKFSAA